MIRTENVADGWGLPKGVVNGWKSDEGHRDNMLVDIAFAGVWKEGNYWTMDMGGDNGKENCNPYRRRPT